MIASVSFVSPAGEATDPSKVEALLYGLTYCEHCAGARALLEELGVPFAVTYLDELDAGVRRPALAKLRRIHGEQVVFPILEIHGEMMFGFDRDIWTKRLMSVTTR